MYTVTLSGLVLHRYGAACGWGPYSSTTDELGEPVTFNSRADAQAWIDARPVFALGAVPSQLDTETISTVSNCTGIVTVTHTTKKGGRPRSTDPRTMRGIRMTAKEWATFQALGGSNWFSATLASVRLTPQQLADRDARMCSK